MPSSSTTAMRLKRSGDAQEPPPRVLTAKDRTSRLVAQLRGGLGASFSRTRPGSTERHPGQLAEGAGASPATIRLGGSVATEEAALFPDESTDERVPGSPGARPPSIATS